ncbi:MAG TPA: hypothetical protein VIM29_03150 [Bacillota bacterium]
MNLQNQNYLQNQNNSQNTFQSFNNQNQNNPNNQYLNNQNQPLNNQNFTNQTLTNQAQLQNEASLAARGYNAQQNLELAAELNQKTPGEIQRILNSQAITNIEFGYIPDVSQMQMNNKQINNMNQNNPNNINAINNALNLGQR